MSAKIDNNHIVDLAREWIGTPYHHQASVKGVGSDCIGLVRGIYHELYGIKPPVFNYSWDWGDSNDNEEILEAGFRYLEPVAREDMQPGDVVAMRWKKGRVAKHVMIMTGPTSAIHAYNRSLVAEINLSPWWMNKIAIVFRFPEVN